MRKTKPLVAVRSPHPAGAGGVAGEPRGLVPSALLAVLPSAAYAGLFLATLHEWFVPFADTSREVAVPLRLLRGEVLYRDVVYQYGLLSPWLDALAMRLFGESLSTLVAVRVLFSLLGIEVLRRLVGGIVRSVFLASCVVTAVVTATFFLPNGGDWPFPYSVAALEGTVGTWLGILLALRSESRRGAMAAGLVAGLAACTKPEFAFLAPLSIAAPLLLRRPRSGSLAALGLAVALPALAWGVPPLVLGVDVLRERGFLIYLDTPAVWRQLYRSLFWGGRTASTFLDARTAATWGLSALFVAAGAAAVRLGGRLGRPGVLLAFAAGAAAVFVPSNGEIQLLVPLAAGVVLVEGVRLARRWRTASDAGATGSVAWLGPPCLVLAVRQPLSVLVGAPYSAFSAPTALAVAVTYLVSLAGAPLHAGAFLLGLSAAQATDRVREHREGPREQVRFERGTVSLYDCEARVVRGLVEWLEKTTPPRGVIGGMPYPGFVLFLADRRSALADDALDPGSFGRAAEEKAVAALETAPLAAGFLVNRPFGEFGYVYFGQGFGENALGALRRRLEPAGRIGGPSPGCPGTALVDTALVMLPPAAGPAAQGAPPAPR